MPQEEVPEQKSSGTPASPTWFLILVSLPIIFGLLWFGRDFLIPLALATLLFILLMALIERADSATIAGKKVPRWMAYIGVTALLFILIAVISNALASQADTISEAAPRYAERLTSLKLQFEGFIGTDMAATLEESLQSLHIEDWLTGFATAAAAALGNIGLILLYVAFMQAERGAFFEKLPRLCATPESAQRVKEMLASISLGVRQYMWINTATSAMSGTLAFIVLTVLGVDFAIPLAFMVFLLNFIPSIGSFLAVVFPTVMALLQFETVMPALIVVAVYGSGDAIIGNIIQPRMQGKSLNLSTFVVMVALTFWSMMWGGIGAFIAVPLTVVFMIVCSEIPGLQPFARLLSSDGILPKEHQSLKDQHETSDATLARSALGGDGGGNADASNSANSITEADEELAMMKQELLERKKARQHESKTSVDGKPKPDRR